MKKLVLSLSLMLLLLPFGIKADEGMWLPMFIARLNYVDMQKEGLHLTPEEIYSVNHSSLKDAIVMLSGGSCTAEIISKQGLTLTNHHCAYGAIQSNSTPEHNYLQDGFWAFSRDQELPAEGMTASFLVRMEDVTDAVLEKLTDDMSETEREQVIRQVSDSIRKAAVEGTDYNASVKSFFEGNEFYLFVYITYQDVRLVGAPPESIGKFGHDTDNWMWPRHTGDFSLLRIYMGQDGKPAPYSKENIPIEPKHSLPVSLKGVKENDFAMIMGYPGSTDRYATSWKIAMDVELDQPARIKIRGKKLDIYKEFMDADTAVYIKYASKYARVSNYWKYFIGQTTQVKKNHVIEKKQEIEKQFTDFVNSSPEHKEKYGEALPLIKEGIDGLRPYKLTSTYLGECVLGSEILLMAFRMQGIQRALSADNPDPVKLNAQIQRAKSRGKAFYKDYVPELDKKVTAAMLEMYHNDIPEEQQPQYFKDLVKKYKGDFVKLTDKLFEKSFLSNEESFNAFLLNADKKTIDKDPAMKLAGSFLGYYYDKYTPAVQPYYEKLEKGNRLFVAGLREAFPEKKFYPNANSTMRLTYGQVKPYAPYDAVSYNYFTTLKGVMEKEDPDNPEFIVPDKLKMLYKTKDYGRYKDADGTMHVCFLTNNDITGGNSGSPVINADGHLIGAAFDGNWEAMSGDIYFEPNIQRTIVVDIRYVLFIIDKYAGAQNLIDEMELVMDPSKIEKAPEPANLAVPAVN